MVDADKIKEVKEIFSRVLELNLKLDLLKEQALQVFDEVKVLDELIVIKAKSYSISPDELQEELKKYMESTGDKFVVDGKEYSYEELFGDDEVEGEGIYE